jgi:hypothetical protein
MITEVTKQYDYNGTFCSYGMIRNGLNSAVPLDPENADYQEIQKWIADGGTVIDNGGGE